MSSHSSLSFINFILILDVFKKRKVVIDYLCNSIIVIYIIIVIHARNFNINAVKCTSILKDHMSLFCLCVFCDSFLCSISLLLLSGSLSCILNGVL